MAMQKLYYRIQWENYPSDKTPVNEQNLNKMDAAIDGFDNRIITLDSTKFDKSEAQKLVKYIAYDEDTGIFTITHYNGASYEIDTLLEKLAVNFDYDYLTQQLIITLSDGEIKYVDLSALITQYEFVDSETIHFVVPLRDETAFENAWESQSIDIIQNLPDGKEQKRIIIKSDIDLSYIGGTYKKTGKEDEIYINFSEKPAGQKKVYAATFVGGAKSYEIHCETTEIIEEDEPPKIVGYYAKNGSVSAEVIEGSIQEKHLRPNYLADIKVEVAKAQKSAEMSAESASVAAYKMILAESWAQGGTGVREDEEENSSKAWCEKSKEYAKGWRGSLLPQGTIKFSELPTEDMEKGHLYNISDAFVTDNRFEEGAGYSYPAGTNIYWNQYGHWDCLSGTLTKTLTQKEYDALPEEEKLNGTIYFISDGDNGIPDATDTEKGLVIVDSELSEESENPVQNKVIAEALKSLPASDSNIFVGYRGYIPEADLNTFVSRKSGGYAVELSNGSGRDLLTVLSAQKGNASSLEFYHHWDFNSGLKVRGSIDNNRYTPWKTIVFKEELDELKKSVSDGKTKVANAITDKGIATATDATFQTIADNIKAIEAGHAPIEWENTSNGTYKFVQFGHTWVSNNNGKNSTTATSTWTVELTEQAEYTFCYGVNSESNYDKLTINVNGITVANAISGSKKESATVTLNAGTNTIVATYTKDSSNSTQNDCGYIVLSDVYGTVIKTGCKVASTPGSSAQIIKPDSGFDGMASVYVPAAASADNGTAVASDVRNGKTFSSSAGIGLTGSMPETTGNKRAGGYFLDGSSTRYVNLKIPSNGYYTTDASIYMDLASCGLTEGSGGGSTTGLSPTATGTAVTYSSGMTLATGFYLIVASGYIVSGTTTPTLTFTYGNASNVNVIATDYYRFLGNDGTITRFAVIYVKSSTTLKISSSGTQTSKKIYKMS